MTAPRLPIHRRTKNPPRMALTERDKALCIACYRYRVLRRRQIQQLCFPDKSTQTANRVLSRLFHHGYLARRIPPIEYGQGLPQPLYLLDQKGADLVAAELGIDRADVSWQPDKNHVSWMFLDHTLRINDFKIGVVQAAARAGYTLERWIDESTLRCNPDHVEITTPNGNRKKVPVIPDWFFVLNLGHSSASFFLEVDMATISNTRWAQRIRAYLEYVRTGRYQERYQTDSLRVLTLVPSPKRLSNLKTTTEKAASHDASLFCFTHFNLIRQNVLTAPIWDRAGEDYLRPLIS